MCTRTLSRSRARRGRRIHPEQGAGEEKAGREGWTGVHRFTRTQTVASRTRTHTEGDITRSADRSISSRLRAGESLAMVLSVDTGLKMEASPTTIDRGGTHSHSCAVNNPPTHPKNPRTDPGADGLQPKAGMSAPAGRRPEEGGDARGAPGAATCCSLCAVNPLLHASTSAPEPDTMKRRGRAREENGRSAQQPRRAESVRPSV